MSTHDLMEDHGLLEEQAMLREAWSGPHATPARLAYRARLNCWMLRILLGANGMPAYCEPGSPRLGVIADVLNIRALADPGCTVQQVQLALQGAMVATQARMQDDCLSPAVADCAMLHTVNWLARQAGLDEVEHEIFEFAAAMRAFRPLRLALSTWNTIGIGDLPQALSGLLNRPLHRVMAALDRDSRLLNCGLLQLNTYGDNTLDRLIKVPRVLGQRMAVHEGEPALILSHLVVPLVRPTLQLLDFHYMQADTRLAQIWLAGALQAATDSSHDRGQGGAIAVRGTHLLVSGAPGLGKTEWVRALLSECDVSTADQAMELVVLDEDGTALSGEDRLSHLRLSLSMLRNRIGGVIVFDEADDVFQGSSEPGDAGSDSAAVSMANHRASLNRLIEDSRIPVIWIMNHPEILDPAVLRRFDTVIAFEGIPASVRLAMLQQRLGPVIDDAELRRWAAIAQLTPALIDRLAVVHERARLGGVPMEVSDCRHWLCSRLPGKHSSALKRPAVRAPWDGSAVKASEDLLALAQGIGRCGSARLLLYGEPGTGKTAYAHALAQLLDKPLLEKRASDLLSPWVGETEQRISQAFEAALQDDAVLFIDEVDSLLASRSQAVRNWEVSQVNELLEQLSDFGGIVVLATNRLDALDDAVLRRMDAKIRFDVLGPEELRDSFVSLCRQMAVEPDAHDLAAAARLTGLTPGDFACVQRRLAFAPLPDGADPGHALVVLLLAELRLKRRASQSIGFLPPKGMDAALDELARYL